METERQSARTLYGIEVRTSNATPGDIAAVWKRFFTEGLADEIPQRADDNLIAAYFDYAGDHTQPYTFFLGCEVIDVACVADGYVLRSLPAGEYAIFHAFGEMPDALLDTWERIWDSELPRTYEADFEVHDPETPHEVALYIGVR